MAYKVAYCMLYYILRSRFTFRRTPGESKLTSEEVERHLYRLRDKEYPKRPETHTDVQTMFKKPKIMEEYGYTMNKSERFYVGSVIRTIFAFHVFASFSTINFIKKHISPVNRNYLLDGTFKIVPKPSKLFSQLLIISIEYKNDVSLTKKNIQ